MTGCCPPKGVLWELEDKSQGRQQKRGCKARKYGDLDAD